MRGDAGSSSGRRFTNSVLWDSTRRLEVILYCPSEADGMAVADLLVSQRHWGQTRCRKLLAQVPMSETKTVRSMTERQRHTLSAMLTTAESSRARRG
jgi:hypothetical protein